MPIFREHRKFEDTEDMKKRECLEGVPIFRAVKDKESSPSAEHFTLKTAHRFFDANRYQAPMGSLTTMKRCVSLLASPIRDQAASYQIRRMVRGHALALACTHYIDARSAAS
jgi:hypothetical protein